MRKTSILVAVLVASLVVLTGPAVAQDGLGSVSVNAGAQATTGDNVTIDSVEMNQSGWVAVYEEESVGEEPDMNSLVGAAEVDEGTTIDVEVDTEIEESGFYYAVLHYDESASTEFDPQADPVVELNGTQVQDIFFVAVGTRDIHGQYANAKQNRRTLQNRLDNLRERVNELERRNQRSDNASIQADIDRLNSEIDTIEGEVQTLDDTISETESLLQRLEETEQQAEESTGGDGTDGNGTAGADNETDTNETEDEETDGGSEGLPGFTAVAALVAALTVALLARRNG